MGKNYFTIKNDIAHLWICSIGTRNKVVFCAEKKNAKQFNISKYGIEQAQTLLYEHFIRYIYKGANRRRRVEEYNQWLTDFILPQKQGVAPYHELIERLQLKNPIK